MLVGSANLDAANTAFVTNVNAIFDNVAPSTFQAYTEVIPADGTSVEIPVVDGLPTFREWLGAKQYLNLRAYKKSVALRQWEASFALKRTLVDGDRTGVVASRIGGFSARIPVMLEKIMLDAMLANSITGYDGQAALSDAHPNVGTSCTSDNLSTNALSFAEFDTADQAIREMGDENGTYLGLVPTHLLVGTAQRRIGMEITGSTRPAAIGTTGAFVTAAAVAAYGTENYVGGSVNLLVSPWITGNQWFAMALNVPGVKPWALAEFRRAVAIAQTDMTDSARFENDEYRWSIEADLSPVPAAWQCIYGSVT